jgi:hypothetical protein
MMNCTWPGFFWNESFGFQVPGSGFLVGLTLKYLWGIRKYDLLARSLPPAPGHDPSGRITLNLEPPCK